MKRSEIREAEFFPDSARCAVGTTQQGASLLHLGYVVASSHSFSVDTALQSFRLHVYESLVG